MNESMDVRVGLASVVAYLHLRLAGKSGEILHELLLGGKPVEALAAVAGEAFEALEYEVQTVGDALSSNSWERLVEPVVDSPQDDCVSQQREGIVDDGSLV